MSDERIVEVMAYALEAEFDGSGDVTAWKQYGEEALAALRDAGFEVVRSDS